MAQQKKRKSHKYETAGKPKPSVEIDDEDGYEQPDNITANKHKGNSRTERKKIGNTTFQRMKKRAEKDFSLRYDGGQRMNETNPHQYDRDGRHSHFYKARENQMSPHSRMMFQSEAQFLDNYGERPIGRFNGQQSNQENTMWDKLSKIFTFGCIETSHNNKP